MIAPEFPAELEWLNLASPLRMARLRGRVCALAFVNVASAWSRQRLDDLAKLQARHGGSVQVVAIHVPRFEQERDTARMTVRMDRWKGAFPIAQDRDWRLWQHCGIEAWPTVLLLDAEGRIRETIVGDGPVRELDAALLRLAGELAPSVASQVPVELRRDPEPQRPLRFPTGLALSEHCLYVADSTHHRVLECDRVGRVLRQFGSGGAGFTDGPMELANFDRPHGLWLERDLLYVVDAGNHAVRRITLRSGEVATVCGSGQRGTPQQGPVGDPRAIPLDRPRAVTMVGGRMFIATVGDNRIWSYDPGNPYIELVAGTGALALIDGGGPMAAFAGPLALTAVQQTLYVCDASGSAIRSLNVRSGQVTTLVGQDPWDYGKADGVRSEARLQQPQAVALDPDSPLLWIADGGNDALRTLRLGGGELKTWPLSEPLHAPTGLAVDSDAVWIADTEAHSVLRLDKKTGALRHVPIGE